MSEKISLDSSESIYKYHLLARYHYNIGHSENIAKIVGVFDLQNIPEDFE